VPSEVPVAYHKHDKSFLQARQDFIVGLKKSFQALQIMRH
jgi:hypothetical protein